MGLDRTIDITGQQLTLVLALLERHLPNTEAWAYGSRVKWTSRPQSDLDLVVFATEEQRRQVEVLRQAFDESDLPFRVDLFVWDEVPVSFHREIEEEHVSLVASGPLGPEEWRESTWGEEIALEYGKALREYDASKGRFRVFGSNGPIGWTDQALVSGPGVILGRKGAYRGVEYSSDPFFVIDTAYYVVSKARHDMRWLFFAIRHYKLGEIDDGSPIPSTTRAAVYPRELAVPPRSEQRAIGRVLGTLDDKIELNRRMNATLEAMARALFKSWFVDFDPVRAKMKGRDAGMPQDIADLFPDRLVDSTVGAIPEGWHPGTLADLAFLNPESWTNRNAPDSIRYVDLANTKWGDIDHIREFRWAEAPSRGRRVLRRGDTIVGTVRPGNGSYALVDQDGLTGSTGFAVLRPKNATEREIVWCAATSRESIERLAHLADGGAYPAVRPAAVLETIVVLPDERLRREFSSLVAPLLSQPQTNRRGARVLAKLRDKLLPRLISGETRVREVEGVLEPVT